MAYPIAIFKRNQNKAVYLFLFAAFLWAHVITRKRISSKIFRLGKPNAGPELELDLTAVVAIASYRYRVAEKQQVCPIHNACQTVSFSLCLTRQLTVCASVGVRECWCVCVSVCA